MRIAGLITIVVMLGGAAPHARLPDIPDCGVYAFSLVTEGALRHGRLILGAHVASPDEALRIAQGAAQDIAQLVDLDVIEVRLGLPQDAPALAAASNEEAGARALAHLRHLVTQPDGAAAWLAQLTTSADGDDARGRRTAGRALILDGDAVAARVARAPLRPDARAGLCGIL